MANGNPVAGTAVTWAVATGGGSLGSTVSPSNASGQSSSILTPGSTAGANSVTATATGLAGSPLTFTATGQAGAASQVVFSVQPSANATLNGAFSTYPQVVIKDASGNIVSSTATVTLSAYTDSNCTTSAGSGVLSNASMAAVAGTAAFSSLTYSVEETIYLKASSTGLTPACTTVGVAVTTTAPSSCRYAMASPTYIVGTAVTANSLICGGGGSPTSCTSSATLPTGLSLAANCQLTGTPSATQSATSYTITATNGSGSTTAPLSITVAALPSWDSTAVVAGVTLSNSNLTASIIGAKSTRANYGKSSGKWYWELTINQNATTYATMGIGNSSASLNTYVGADANGWGMSAANGNKYNSAVGQGFGSALTVGDVIGFALDASSGKLDVYKNGTRITAGSMLTGLTTGVTYYPMYANTWASTTEATTAKFTAPFTHTPPTGYLGIGQGQTLADPVIDTPSAGASATTSTVFSGTCVASSTISASGTGITVNSATCDASGVLTIDTTLTCAGSTSTSRVLSVSQTDASGNYSNTVTRSVEMSTTCVRWASLGTANVTLSESNLKATTGATATARADTGKSTGKWYWEIKINTAAAVVIGVATGAMDLTTWPGSGATSWSMSGYSGDKYYNGAGAAFAGGLGGTLVANDVIGVAFDATNGILYLYKNGVQLPTTGATHVYNNIPTGVTYYPVFGNSYAPFGAAAGTATFNAPFTYTPPTGFSGF